MDTFVNRAYGTRDINHNHPFGGFMDNRTAQLFSPEENGGAIDNFWPSSCSYQGNPQYTQDFQDFSNFMVLDGGHLDEVSTTALQSLGPSATQPNDFGISVPIPISISSSLELLNNRVPSAHDHAERQRTAAMVQRRVLSTEEVIRVSAAHFIQLSALVSGDPLKLRLPFGLSYSALTSDEVRNVELTSLLMAAAEKVNTKQLDRASSLLKQCHMLSSSNGNPIQRLAHYFSEALQDRIDRESGKLSPKGSNGTEIKTAEDVVRAILTNHSVYLKVNDILPFTPVMNFTSIQAILDSVASAKRIHIIDLSIKHGMQWTVLMQDLATRHIDSLKISAVGESNELMAMIGKQLSSFADSMELCFEFKTVIVADLKDLREDMFEVEEGEALGIYSDLLMNSLLVKTQSLENLMRVLQKLKPCVMTVQDVEAKHNSRSFIDRFTEALFYFGAFFDCLDALMEKSDTNRVLMESGFFAEGIKCILATEGSERVIRHVGIKVWRSFLTRYGFAELQLSDKSIYQATLLANQYVKDGSYTLARNGYSLVSGWKGTPLHFVSAWKFQEA